MGKLHLLTRDAPMVHLWLSHLTQASAWFSGAMAHVLQITQGVTIQLCAHITSMRYALCVRLYSKSALRRGAAAPRTVTSLTQERPENTDRGGRAPRSLAK